MIIDIHGHVNAPAELGAYNEFLPIGGTIAVFLFSFKPNGANIDKTTD